MLKISERNYARESLSDYTSNLKKQWKVINSLIERGQCSALPSAMRIYATSPRLSNAELTAEKNEFLFINADENAVSGNPISATDRLSLSSVTWNSRTQCLLFLPQKRKFWPQ